MDAPRRYRRSDLPDRLHGVAGAGDLAVPVAAGLVHVAVLSAGGMCRRPAPRRCMYVRPPAPDPIGTGGCRIAVRLVGP